jgi:hypothetical protein
MTNTTKKNIAIAKLVNLASALADCGIDAEITEVCDGNPLLLANLWNCQDGSTIRLEVFADKENDYEIEPVANPVVEMTDFLAQVFSM